MSVELICCWETFAIVCFSTGMQRNLKSFKVFLMFSHIFLSSLRKTVEMGHHAVTTGEKLLKWSWNVRPFKQFTLHSGSSKKIDNLRGSARFFGDPEGSVSRKSLRKIYQMYDTLLKFLWNANQHFQLKLIFGKSNILLDVKLFPAFLCLL
jgi:hypothetical protein